MTPKSYSPIIRYLLVLSLLFIFSCSKRQPQSSSSSTTATKTINTTTVKKGPWPKTLTLNDKVARKAVDGRLYFDLDGVRYWKNYKDGKYYKFDQSMYNDPAFKPKTK